MLVRISGHSNAVLIATFALFVSASGLSAARWQARSWTTDDALPQGTVHGIWQTRDGYLWFTTYGGLVCYDGIAFRVFERATTRGIASNRFTTIFEDSAGTLWAGTEDGYLTASRKGVFRSYRTGAPSNAICAIGESAGALWVLTNDGFLTFDGTSVIPRLPPAFAGTTFTTPFGYGYHQGFSYVSQRGVEIIRPDFRTALTAATGLGPDRPTMTYTDQHGAVWIAQRGRLLRFLNRRIDSFPLATDMPAQAVTAILLASEGALWVAVDGRGVARIGREGVEWVNVPEGLASPSVAR